MDENQTGNRKLAELIDDFQSKTALELSILNEALRRRTLFPYKREAAKLLNLYEARRDYVALLANDSKVSSLQDTYFREQCQRFFCMTERYATKLSEAFDSFDSLYKLVSQRIEIEVLPNPDFDGEMVYLKQGRLIMRTTIKTPGYHVFEIFPERDAKGGIMVGFEQVTAYGLDSIDEALRRHVTKNNIIGTVAIARNTEHYPLKETSLPIVMEKYRRGLMGQK